MNDEEKNVQNMEGENQNQNSKKRKRRRGLLPLVCLCAVVMSMSASATSGGGTTGGGTTSGLSNILAQSTNATTLIGAAFDLISGNAYLALLCFFGLLSVAIRLFRRGKRAAR